MLSRYLTLTIVAFWMVTAGWLFHRDLWPRLRSGEPPPYTIDLADETQRQVLSVPWEVWKGEQKIGSAATSVEYRAADDTFELIGEFRPLKPLKFAGLLSVNLDTKMKTMYRVTREGELREITAKIDADITIVDQNLKIPARVEGQVHDGHFTPRWWIGEEELKIKPVKVSVRGSVLNPLQPLNRISGLRPGQRWQMPLMDPLTDSLLAMVGKEPDIIYLEARVLPDTQPLLWQHSEVSCLVIEYYHENELTARTWVQENTGLVLRQEALLHGDQIVLKRKFE